MSKDFEKFKIQGAIEALSELKKAYTVAKPALYEEWEVEHQIELEINRHEKKLRSLEAVEAGVVTGEEKKIRLEAQLEILNKLSSDLNAIDDDEVYVADMQYLVEAWLEDLAEELDELAEAERVC